MNKQKIVSSINKKGGVGKTTTVGALASICAVLGLKVLVIDLDPQCDASKLLQADLADKNVTNLFKMGRSLRTFELFEIIQRTPFQNIDIIAGSEDLDAVCDEILINNAKIVNGEIILPTQSQCLLTDSLNMLKELYNIILIDNTPYFNLITKNALAASNAVLIPIETDGYSYDGLIKLLQKIYDVKKDVNQELEILGIFATKIKTNRRLFKDLFPELKNKIGDKFLDTYIRDDARAAESATQFIPIYNYAPKSNISFDYMNLLAELKILDPQHQNILEIKISEYEQRKK